MHIYILEHILICFQAFSSLVLMPLPYYDGIMTVYILFMCRSELWEKENVRMCHIMTVL